MHVSDAHDNQHNDAVDRAVCLSYASFGQNPIIEASCGQDYGMPQNLLLLVKGSFAYV